MSSGRSLCTRSLASLSSLQQIQFHPRKIICCCCRCAKIKQNTATIDDNFFQNTPAISITTFKTREVLHLQCRQYYASRAGLVKTSSGVHLQPSKVGTAKQSLKQDPAALSCRICQTRKRCKRPSAKRAPGRHPGLFQISRLFKTCFPADVSPGQEEQSMFRFKDKISLFFSAIVSRR